MAVRIINEDKNTNFVGRLSRKRQIDYLSKNGYDTFKVSMHTSFTGGPLKNKRGSTVFTLEDLEDFLSNGKFSCSISDVYDNGTNFYTDYTKRIYDEYDGHNDYYHIAITGYKSDTTQIN